MHCQASPNTKIHLVKLFMDETFFHFKVSNSKTITPKILKILIISTFKANGMRQDFRDS